MINNDNSSIGLQCNDKPNVKHIFLALDLLKESHKFNLFNKRLLSIIEKDDFFKKLKFDLNNDIRSYYFNLYILIDLIGNNLSIFNTVLKNNYLISNLEYFVLRIPFPMAGSKLEYDFLLVRVENLFQKVFEILDEKSKNEKMFYVNKYVNDYLEDEINEINNIHYDTILKRIASFFKKNKLTLFIDWNNISPYYQYYFYDKIDSYFKDSYSILELSKKFNDYSSNLPFNDNVNLFAAFLSHIDQKRYYNKKDIFRFLKLSIFKKHFHLLDKKNIHIILFIRLCTPRHHNFNDVDTDKLSHYLFVDTIYQFLFKYDYFDSFNFKEEDVLFFLKNTYNLCSKAEGGNVFFYYEIVLKYFNEKWNKKFDDLIEPANKLSNESSKNLKMENDKIEILITDKNYQLFLDNNFDILDLCKNSESGHTQRAFKSYIERHGRLRRLANIDNKILDELNNLYHDFPHFEKVIDYIKNNLHLQTYGDNLFYFGAILLNGDTGIGKTFFSSQIAKIAGLPYENLYAPSLQGVDLHGQSSVYINNKMGKILNNLLKINNPMNMIFLIDEIDKINKNNVKSASLENILLNLLDENTSKEFTDISCNVNIDASYINWILTSNETDSISVPFLNRVKTFNIPNPNKLQFGKFIQAIYKNILSSKNRKTSYLKHFNEQLPEETVNFLIDISSSETKSIGFSGCKEINPSARDMKKILNNMFYNAIIKEDINKLIELKPEHYSDI